MEQKRKHGKGYKEVQNGPLNSIPDDFIPNGLNPDNGAFFGYASNPLSSKGNSVSEEEPGLFNPPNTNS